MPVDNIKIIDAISTRGDKSVVLTISDHLEWDKEKEHLIVLQNKVNAYLAFIENGELSEQYPKETDAKIVFNLVFMYPPDEDGKIFLDRLKEILEDSGYGCEWQSPKT